MELTASLSLPEWDGLTDAEAEAAVREIERRQPRAKWLGFEAGPSPRRIALFDVGGVRMCLVPGARVTLGFDEARLDASAAAAWAASFKNEGHAAQQVVGGPDAGAAPPSDLVAFVRDQTTPIREVELLPFLAERDPGPSREDLSGDGDGDPHDEMAAAVVREAFGS